MIIKVRGLEPLGPIGVYAYACNFLPRGKSALNIFLRLRLPSLQLNKLACSNEWPLLTILSFFYSPFVKQHQANITTGCAKKSKATNSWPQFC